MVQPKSIITKLFVTVISYAPNGLFLNRPYDHHVMFVNILISILYFAIHVTRLTLNPNVFITRFHFEAHLSSNLTGGRFIYWLTSHCITRPTVWIAIFRWAWTSGTSNLLISLNCTFWEKKETWWLRIPQSFWNFLWIWPFSIKDYTVLLGFVLIPLLQLRVPWSFLKIVKIEFYFNQGYRCHFGFAKNCDNIMVFLNNYSQI